MTEPLITLPSREEMLRLLNTMGMGNNALIAENLFPLIAGEADRTMTADEFVAMLMEKFTEFDAQTRVNLKPALQCLIGHFINVLIVEPNQARAAKVSWRKLQDPFSAFTRTITMIWGGDGKN